MLDVETKHSLFKVTLAVIVVPNCGTLQTIISRIFALHEGNVFEDHDRFHTTRLSFRYLMRFVDRRVTNIIYSCLHCDSHFILSVVLYIVYKVYYI